MYAEPSDQFKVAESTQMLQTENKIYLSDWFNLMVFSPRVALTPFWNQYLFRQVARAPMHLEVGIRALWKYKDTL